MRLRYTQLAAHDYHIPGEVPWGILRVSGVSLKRLLRGETILLMKGGDTMSSDIGKAIRSGNLGISAENTVPESIGRTGRLLAALDELNEDIERLENTIDLLNDKIENLEKEINILNSILGRLEL